MVADAGQELVVARRRPALRRPRRRGRAAGASAMDLDYREDALTWEPGMRGDWELWGDWHASTAQSTGFSELGDPPPPPSRDEPRLLEAYERALPVYERLAARAI